MQAPWELDPGPRQPLCHEEVSDLIQTLQGHFQVLNRGPRKWVKQNRS